MGVCRWLQSQQPSQVSRQRIPDHDALDRHRLDRAGPVPSRPRIGQGSAGPTARRTTSYRMEPYQSIRTEPENGDRSCTRSRANSCHRTRTDPHPSTQRILVRAPPRLHGIPDDADQSPPRAPPSPVPRPSPRSCCKPSRSMSRRKPNGSSSPLAGVRARRGGTTERTQATNSHVGQPKRRGSRDGASTDRGAVVLRSTRR